ncbi:MAG: hypothetical protein ABIY90_15650 [Puia sp.]
MNQKNFEYLKQYVTEAGFPDSVAQQLKARLKDTPPDFSIEYQPDFGDDSVFAILQFKHWKETDLYYFHRYHLIISRENTRDCLQQIFYYGKNGPVIELLKGYNLLYGRAVYCEKLLSHVKVEYNSWIQFNFLETDAKGNFRLQYFTDGYGFDLNKTLERFPFLELEKPDSLEKLIGGLRKGNREPVTLSLDGKICSYDVEAVPQFKSLRIFDAEGKLLSGNDLAFIVSLSGQDDMASIEDSQKEGKTNTADPATRKKENVSQKRVRA